MSILLLVETFREAELAQLERSRKNAERADKLKAKAQERKAAAAATAAKKQAAKEKKEEKARKKEVSAALRMLTASPPPEILSGAEDDKDENPQTQGRATRVRRPNPKYKD